MGVGLLVNGKDQMIQAVRNNLFQGASQIKLCVTGGVSSFSDPLYVMEFTEEEITAAVNVAADYGTYVMVHAHSAEGIKRAIKAGVKTIEHASLADEECFKLMAEKDVYVSIQFLIGKQGATAFDKSDPRYEKSVHADHNIINIIKYIKKYNVKVGWGTDLLEGIELRKQQLNDLSLRTEWFTPAEIMIQATGINKEILSLTGKRNPYGTVGVIEKGALADILIYDQNPLEDIEVVCQPEKHLQLIMKDGVIYKNTIE
ncbi:amidohydrolase family protein [Prolixibacteraceae bacterium]|nr:amidohydrolase family protein [Prolixibacteraceae bacterium]